MSLINSQKKMIKKIIYEKIGTFPKTEKNNKYIEILAENSLEKYNDFINNNISKDEAIKKVGREIGDFPSDFFIIPKNEKKYNSLLLIEILSFLAFLLLWIISSSKNDEQLPFMIARAWRQGFWIPLFILVGGLLTTNILTRKIEIYGKIKKKAILSFCVIFGLIIVYNVIGYLIYLNVFIPLPLYNGSIIWLIVTDFLFIYYVSCYFFGFLIAYFL
ncbi:MAG: hypothetical protein WC123_06730 [Bacilli bacterium]|nr:hypothetical protein [Bacilli bacterium]